MEVRVENDPVDIVQGRIDLRITYGRHHYPSLVIDPESTTLFSKETKESNTGYQNDCGSLLGNLNRTDENPALREQCLGGINTDGKNWSLELRGAMTCRFDSNAEKIDIKPCPEGDITECTTLGIGLKVDIP